MDHFGIVCWRVKLRVLVLLTVLNHPLQHSTLTCRWNTIHTHLLTKIATLVRLRVASPAIRLLVLLPIFTLGHFILATIKLFIFLLWRLACFIWVSTRLGLRIVAVGSQLGAVHLCHCLLGIKLIRVFSSRVAWCRFHFLRRVLLVIAIFDILHVSLFQDLREFSLKIINIKCSISRSRRVLPF